jgi:allantoate deiminase
VSDAETRRRAGGETAETLPPQGLEFYPSDGSPTAPPGEDQTRVEGAAEPYSSRPPLGANPSRLADDLRAIAEIGALPGGGVTRPGLTPLERLAHELAGGWLRELGLQVHTDAIGNTIAERRGRRPAPFIGLGSHLDSVPQGGRFDGIVGVVGAVELVRLLNEADLTTEHPLRIVLFVAEEGARFGESCIGSKAIVGGWDGRDLSRVQDADGVRLPAALEALGFDPSRLSDARWTNGEVAAFLELHIEQGRVLEAEGSQVGLVDVVSGSTRLRLEVQGRADHSGGAPMSLRADALNAAAEIALTVEALATDPRHRGTRATIGRLNLYPNSITTVPGTAIMVVDVRDVDSDRQRSAAGDIVQRAHWICERRAIRLEAEVIADTSPAVLSMWLRELTSNVCRDLGLNYRVMTSGAGHDAAIMARLVPAGMVFVPSRDGLSHVPEEWTSAADIARGVEVMYHAVLRLDRFLAEQEGRQDLS